MVTLGPGLVPVLKLQQDQELNSELEMGLAQQLELMERFALVVGRMALKVRLPFDPLAFASLVQDQTSSKALAHVTFPQPWFLALVAAARSQAKA